MYLIVEDSIDGNLLSSFLQFPYLQVKRISLVELGEKKGKTYCCFAFYKLKLQRYALSILTMQTTLHMSFDTYQYVSRHDGKIRRDTL